jgi:alpha-amylase
MKTSFFFLAALQFAARVFTADTAAWKSRNIYFALTDRIARNNNDNGGDRCGNLGNYCGGTFAGIQSKLDYIQGMGFDAIWLTPVVASEYPSQPFFFDTFPERNMLLTRSSQTLPVAIMAIGPRIFPPSTPTMDRPTT